MKKPFIARTCGPPDTKCSGTELAGFVGRRVYPHGLYRFHDGALSQIKPAGFDGRVADMTSDPDGALWIATPQGAIRYMDGRAKSMGSSNGLPCENILSVINDRVGSHWLFMQCGILRIRDSEISRWWSNVTSQLKTTTFTLSDGALSRLRGERDRSSARMDGRGPSMEAPPDDRSKPPSIKHCCRRFILNICSLATSSIPLLAVLSFLCGSGQVVEVDYAGLSYVESAKVRFRYQLLGYDKE